nr:hypothetical protein [Kribbella speibonae]
MTVDLDCNALDPDRAGRNVDRLPAKPDAFTPPQTRAASKRDELLRRSRKPGPSLTAIATRAGVLA